MREDQKKELFSWDFRVFVTGAFHLITWTGVTVRINLEFQKNDKIKQKKNKARGRDWPTQTTTHQLMKKKKNLLFSVTTDHNKSSSTKNKQKRNWTTEGRNGAYIKLYNSPSKTSKISKNMYMLWKSQRSHYLFNLKCSSQSTWSCLTSHLSLLPTSSEVHIDSLKNIIHVKHKSNYILILFFHIIYQNLKDHALKNFNKENWPE